MLWGNHQVTTGLATGSAEIFFSAFYMFLTLCIGLLSRVITHLEQALPSVYTLQCLTGKVDNSNNNNNIDYIFPIVGIYKADETQQLCIARDNF